jgi:hypothetical protein
MYIYWVNVFVMIIAEARTDWLAELHNYHVGGAGHQLYMPHGWRARIIQYNRFVPQPKTFEFIIINYVAIREIQRHRLTQRNIQQWP